MTLWAMAAFWTLVGLAALQAVAAVRFLRTMRRGRRGDDTPGWNPKTAVILCLRGPDPFLARCLEAILHQDYPCYDVHIVVDSRNDPAWETVEQVVARLGAENVYVSPLTTRIETCGLKCSSLVQAVSRLDASYEVIALLDADTIAHRTWLRELVAPLADDRVGAATGNRWYMPAVISWGSLVRWLWNAAAVAAMYMFHIPWGGTLALRLDVFRRSDLLDHWANAFAEDTLVYDVLRRMGYRVAFVPSLMMVNRENCSLAGFYRFVQRQLFNTRLYHPGWPLVVGFSLSISAAQLAGFALPAVALGMGRNSAAGWLAAGLGLYWAVMGLLLAAMETGVRRVPAGRGEPATWLRLADWPRVVAAMLLTQVVYSAAIVSTMFLREITWRGIRYRVEGPGKIRMVGYQPFATDTKSRETLRSL